MQLPYRESDFTTLDPYREKSRRTPPGDVRLAAAMAAYGWTHH